MMILLILLILFHHREIILEVLLIFLNLTIYVKLPYWMRTIFCIFFVHINVVL